MPVIDIGHSVTLLRSAGSITVHNHLCTPPNEEDVEYLRRLDPTLVGIRAVYSYEPEWGLAFTDGRNIHLGEDHHHYRYAGTANTMRAILARAVYLAKQTSS
jgi:hypothetical protein